MADSILRLRVQSDEYDQKIKRAAEGIQQYAQKCREVGGTLEHLDDGVLEFVQALGKMDTVATSSKQQLREISNALTNLTITYRGLTDEEKSSPFGQELSKQIGTLTERAGEVKDAMVDVEQSIKNAASDTRGFDQLAQGMSVAMAGFQGLTGAGKLLGIEMGNDVEVIAKLQAAMAVTNSLTTIQTALQKQSALMQGVMAAQASIAAAAQTLLGEATGSATIAQAAFNAVAKANPYVLLATAIAAVGTALWAFSSASSEAKQKEEELAKAEEEARKMADEQRQSFVNASAAAMNTASRLSSLQAAYKNANSEIEKTGILKQAQTEFKKLGIECKGVHDAQTLLIQKGGQIIELIKTQGTVAALSAIRMEKFKESFKMLLENGYSVSAAASLAGYNKDVVELDGQITSMQNRIQNIKGSLGVSSNSSGVTGAKTIKQEEANYATDSIMAQEKEVSRLTDAWKRASEEMRGGILKDLEAAKAKLAEMQKTNSATEGGSIGDIVVKGNIVKSINKNFAEAANNLDSVNNYMNGIKTAIKNADLGSELYDDLTEKLKDATSMSSLIQAAISIGVEGAELDEIATTLKEKLLDGDIPDEVIQNLIDKLNAKIEEKGGVKWKLDPTTGGVIPDNDEDGQKSTDRQEKADGLKEELSKANTALSGLTQINSGLKGMGVDLGKGLDEVLNVAGSFLNILNGLQSFMSIFQSTALASNTAAIQANTLAQGASSAAGAAGLGIGAAASSILAPVAIGAAAVFAAGKIFDVFANGGVVHAANGWVGGNSFSGDTVPILANSGELILNKAQQGVIANDLVNSGMQNIRMSAVIEGEDIKLATTNYDERWGGGETVTSK